MDDALRALMARHQCGDALDASELMALVDGLIAYANALENEIDGFAG
jgi:hypothetical protein